MQLVIVVSWKNSWNTIPNSDDIDHLLKIDLGFDDVTDKLTSMALKGRKLALTAKDHEVKRAIYRKLTTDFFLKYHVVMLEEKKVTVDLLFVPEAMPDPELIKQLSHFGKISQEDVIIHCKN